MEENKITVNDGNGLFDWAGLLDSVVMDCNNLPKTLMNGNYVQFCAYVVQIVQKLSRLKEGIKNDMDSLQKSNDELHSTNRELQRLLYGGGENEKT